MKTDEEFYAEIAAEELALEAHNNQVIQASGISTKDFEVVMDGCFLRGEIEIVDCPNGADNCEDGYDTIKSVFVDQWGVGMDGDSFEGYIYAQAMNDKWLKIPYSC